jgi:hypothetical protein
MKMKPSSPSADRSLKSRRLQWAGLWLQDRKFCRVLMRNALGKRPFRRSREWEITLRWILGKIWEWEVDGRVSGLYPMSDFGKRGKSVSWRWKEAVRRESRENSIQICKKGKRKRREMLHEIEEDYKKGNESYLFSWCMGFESLPSHRKSANFLSIL